MLAALVIVAAVGGVVVWRLTRPPAPVSQSDVLNQFRKTQPSAPATGGGPARGVYIYATTGSEHISAGNITNHYPAHTTLTVADSACGLRIRWDALAGRWTQWDLCRNGTGWRLQRYVEAHKFSFLQDIHDYTCTGYPVVVCRTESDVLTSTVKQVSPGRLRITQEATGKSVKSGVVDVWMLPSGLPQRVVVHDHGGQTVMGQRVTYTESAAFTLTSTTPLR